MSVARVSVARRASIANVGGIHPDAADWSSRVTTNSGSVSATTLQAVSGFCWAIDAAGIRNKFFRLNLLCGTGLASAVVPLYRAPSLGMMQFGATTDTNVNFVSGDYNETGSSGGLQGNGSTKYLTTGFLPTLLTVGSAHLSAYVAGAVTSGTFPPLLGAFVTSGGAELSLYSRGTTTSEAYFASDNGSGFVLSAVSNPTGHVLGVTSAVNDRRVFVNGSQSGSTSTTSSSIALPTTVDINILRRSTGSSSYSNARIAAYSIGSSMTVAQASAFYAAMQAFQTALTRNV